MSSVSKSGSLEFPETSARVWTLSNGLEIIVAEDHAAPVVSLQAWCRAGSIHEGAWLGAGMSHFLEHMLFKGTERRSANDVAREVQASGGYINAYTSFDRTVYWIDCPASGFENCLDVLCDVVGHATIPEEEFDREQEVIRREFAMGDDNPGQVLNKMLFRNCYAIHPCRHPVIGHIDLFDQLSRDDLYQYYRERYSPDNLFFVVAGDVQSSQVIELIEGSLGSEPRRRSAVPILPEEPNQLGKREEVREFPTELSRSRTAWQIPDQSHPDMPALDLLSGVLGNGRSSRFYQSVREEKQLAHAISAYAYSPVFRGIFVVNIDSEPGNLAAAEEAAFEEIEKIKGEPPSDEEIERVRNQALSAQFSTLTDVRGLASDLASNWHTTRNLNFTRDYVREIQKAEAGDVSTAAVRYLNDENFTRAVLTPVAEEEPSSTNLAGSGRSEDIQRFELENGLTVLLLADHRVPFVQANGVFRGGRLSEASDSCGLTRLFGRLLTKDTEKHSALELTNAIESAGGAISAGIGNNSVGVSSGALKIGLKLVVDLLDQALQKPLFLDKAVAKEKQFQISAIKADADQPFTVAMNRLRRELYGAHPYGLPDKGTEESLQGMTSGDLQDFREKLFRGGNGVIGLFGDLDLGEAEDLVRAAFENLPAGPRLFDELSELDQPENPGEVIEEKHDKEQAILLIGYRTCALHHKDNFTLGLIDEACSDMASRMFVRIREELGLAYSVGCVRMQGLAPGYLAFYAATSPEQLDLVQEEMIHEIGLITDNGLASEEIERSKASWLGREVIHLQGARELAGVATVDELVGLGWDHYRRVPQKIEEITDRGVRETAQKYLRDENRIIVRLTT